MTYNRVVGLKKINFDLFVSCIRFPIACYQIVIWLQDELNMIMICPDLIGSNIPSNGDGSSSSSSSSSNGNIGNSGSSSSSSSSSSSANNTSNINNDNKVDKNADNNNHDKNNNNNNNDDDDNNNSSSGSNLNKYLLSTKTFLHAKYIGCQRHKKVPNVDLDLVKNYLTM